MDNARPVAVIGADLVDAFFGSMEPLGQRDHRSTAAPFRVVGVAERKGSVFGQSQDNFVWMPITPFRKLYGARRSIVIQAEAQSMDVFEEAQDQARVAMRVRRHLDYAEPDDFSDRDRRERARPAGRRATRGSTSPRSWSRPSACWWAASWS